MKRCLLFQCRHSCWDYTGIWTSLDTSASDCSEWTDHPAARSSWSATSWRGTREDCECAAKPSDTFANVPAVENYRACLSSLSRSWRERPTTLLTGSPPLASPGLSSYYYQWLDWLVVPCLPSLDSTPWCTCSLTSLCIDSGASICSLIRRFLSWWRCFSRAFDLSYVRATSNLSDHHSYCFRLVLNRERSWTHYLQSNRFYSSHASDPCLDLFVQIFDLANTPSCEFLMSKAAHHLHFASISDRQYNWRTLIATSSCRRHAGREMKFC